MRFQQLGGADAAEEAEEGGEAGSAASSPTAAGSPQQQSAGQGTSQAPVLGPDGRRAIGALFDGIASEFHNMVRLGLPQTSLSLSLI